MSRVRRVVHYVMTGVLAVSSIATLLIANTSTASALQGSGYFTNSTTCTATGNFTVRNCGENTPPYSNDIIAGRTSPSSPDSIPDSATSSKNAFYSWLKGLYDNNSASSHNGIGARFIASTMLKESSHSGASSVTAADMTSLKDRLDQSDITMSVITAVPNNYGSVSFMGLNASNKTDAFYTSSYLSGPRELVVFKKGSTVLYVLEKPCGNPVGGLPGIPSVPPPAGWDINGSTTVTVGGATSSSNINVAPGTRVTFRSYLQNAGPAATNKAVDWSTTRTSPIPAGTNNQSEPWPTNRPKGNPVLVNTISNWQVPTNAPEGRQYCVYINYRPRASGSTATESGNKTACVTVRYDWSISGRTTVNDTTATPGQTVIFRSYLKNNGPTATDQAISWRLERTPTSIPAGTGTWATGQNDNAEGNVSTVNFVIPTTATAGQTFCVAISFTPSTDSSSTRVTGTRACVTVVYDYALVPTVEVTTGSTISVGGLIHFDYKVKNPGSVSYPTKWQECLIVANPGVTPNTASRDGVSCASYTAPGVTSTLATNPGTSGTRTFPGGGPPTTVNPEDYPVTQAVGTRICRVLIVDSYDETPAPHSRGSTMTCVVVGKNPKVQIWGGDLKTNGQIVTSTTPSAGKTYGSWAEYGALSKGINQQLGTGSGLNGGATVDRLAWSGLTFANTGAPTTYGKLSTSAGSLPTNDLYNHFVDQCAGTGCSAFSTLNGANGKYKASGNITLSGAALQPGQSITLVVNGNVTITGPITYPAAPMSDIGQLTQLVIVAKNITINSNVPRVDAWLVSNGPIKTCETPFSSGFSANDCKVALRTNGPIYANSLTLARTAGSDTTSIGDPAEIFDGRADALLWAYTQNNGLTVAHVTNVTELPPRF